jgi:hypothetical protein
MNWKAALTVVKTLKRVNHLSMKNFILLLFYRPSVIIVETVSR